MTAAAETRAFSPEVAVSAEAGKYLTFSLVSEE